MSNRIATFFAQPITAGSLAADARALAGLLTVALAIALGIAFVAHVPMLLMAAAAVWALMNGRVFSMIFFSMLAVAWFNWLWGIAGV